MCIPEKLLKEKESKPIGSAVQYLSGLNCGKSFKRSTFKLYGRYIRSTRFCQQGDGSAGTQTAKFKLCRFKHKVLQH